MSRQQFHAIMRMFSSVLEGMAQYGKPFDILRKAWVDAVVVEMEVTWSWNEYSVTCVDRLRRREDFNDSRDTIALSQASPMMVLSIHHDQKPGKCHNSAGSSPLWQLSVW